MKLSTDLHVMDDTSPPCPCRPSWHGALVQGDAAIVYVTLPLEALPFSDQFLTSSVCSSMTCSIITIFSISFSIEPLQVQRPAV